MSGSREANDVAHALACRVGIHADICSQRHECRCCTLKRLLKKSATDSLTVVAQNRRRVYSHLLSRDRRGAVVLVLFQQPLKRAPRFSAYGVNTSFIETVTVVL